MTYYKKSKSLTKEEESRAGAALLDFLNYVNNCEYRDKDAMQYHLSVLVSMFTNHYGQLEDYYKITLCKAYLSSKLKEEGFEKAITVKTDDYLGFVHQK